MILSAHNNHLLLKAEASLPALAQSIPTPYVQSQLSHNFSLDSIAYTKLVQLSARTGSLIYGKLAHAHMIRTAFKPCMFLLNNLLYMYIRCGEVFTAQNLFHRMPKPDIISYNSLISGYSQMGLYGKIMHAFNGARMTGLRLDRFTYAGALNACGQTGNIKLGKQVHGLIISSGLIEEVFLINSLMDMYSRCGQVDQTTLLFETSSDIDHVSWNSLIASYVRIGANEKVYKLLTEMHHSGLVLNAYTVGSVLKVCCTNRSNSREYGKILHGYAIKLGLDLDVVIGTALLDMYAKIGNLEDAIDIFKTIPTHNVITYNAMTASFLQADTLSGEHGQMALSLFSDMQRQGMKPSKFTFPSILKACIVGETYEYGKQLHAHICKNNLQSDEFIGSALVELYSSLGSIEDAMRCFHSTPKLDVVSWTSMIVAYVQNGNFEHALSLFCQFLASGREPDEFVISTMLGACADLASIRSGEQIQGYALKLGLANCTIIQNSQICMYAKSGDIDSAHLTFKETGNPDVVSWSVMICSKAQHGYAKEALRLFEFMINCGVEPNYITFMGVLTACSHGGLVDEGLKYFEMMKKDYQIETNEKHCSCVVDLLGRAGRLEAAHKFILDSGFECNPVLWRALLSACRVQKNTVMAKSISERIIELEPQASSSYVLLYNVYSDSGKESDALNVRKLMEDRGVKKDPGMSWIEVGNKVHSFVIGDQNHPMSQIILSVAGRDLEEDEC